MAVTVFADPLGRELADQDTQSLIDARQAQTGLNLLNIQQAMDQRKNMQAFMLETAAEQRARQQAAMQQAPQSPAAIIGGPVQPGQQQSASGMILNEMQGLDSQIDRAMRYNLPQVAQGLQKQREAVQARYASAVERESRMQDRQDKEIDRRVKAVSAFASGANSLLMEDSPDADKVSALQSMEQALRAENPEAWKIVARGQDSINWGDRRTWLQMKALEQQAIDPAKRTELAISKQRADEQAARDATYAKRTDAMIAAMRERGDRSAENDDFGKLTPGKRWIDPKNKSLGMEDIPDKSKGTVPSEAKGLSGQAFLDALPAEQQNLVKGIAEGRIDARSLSTRGGERERVLSMVTQYKPEFNQAKYPVYQAVQKDFTSGTAAKNVTAINTAIGHMGTLDQLGKALDNNDYPKVNQLLNYIGTQTGNPNTNNLKVASSALGSEMMRVFRQVGASEKEQKEWEEKFSSVSSPAQLKGALQTAGSLLKSRIEAVDDQWRRGMDTKEGYPDLLSPKSQQVLGSLGVKLDRGFSVAKPAKSSGPLTLEQYLSNQGH